MATGYESPTLATIAARVGSDIQTALIQAPYLLMRFLKWAGVASVGGASWGLHKAVEAAALQGNPVDATAEGLDKWGLTQNRPRNPATQFVGTFKAFALAGSVVDTTARLARQGDGALYAVTTGHTWGVVNGYYNLPIQSVAAGADYNLEVGDLLTFVSPPVGVNTAGTVYSVTTNGVDAEDDDTYRVPVLAAFQGAGAQGGTADDYEAWALAVAGTYSAAVTSPTPGTVTVTLAASNGATPPGPAVPDAALLSAVAAAIALVKPVDDVVSVVAWSA